VKRKRPIVWLSSGNQQLHHKRQQREQKVEMQRRALRLHRRVALLRVRHSTRRVNLRVETCLCAVNLVREESSP